MAGQAPGSTFRGHGDPGGLLRLDDSQHQRQYRYDELPPRILFHEAGNGDYGDGVHGARRAGQRLFDVALRRDRRPSQRTREDYHHRRRDGVRRPYYNVLLFPGGGSVPDHDRRGGPYKRRVQRPAAKRVADDEYDFAGAADGPFNGLLHHYDEPLPRRKGSGQRSRSGDEPRGRRHCGPDFQQRVHDGRQPVDALLHQAEDRCGPGYRPRQGRGDLSCMHLHAPPRTYHLVQEGH